MLYKSMNCFLYDRDLRFERVKHAELVLYSQATFERHLNNTNWELIEKNSQTFELLELHVQQACFLTSNG